LWFRKLCAILSYALEEGHFVMEPNENEKLSDYWRERTIMLEGRMEKYKNKLVRVRIANNELALCNDKQAVRITELSSEISKLMIENFTLRYAIDCNNFKSYWESRY